VVPNCQIRADFQFATHREGGFIDKPVGLDKIEFLAEVAELADALRSGRSGHELVRVQISPSAQELGTNFDAASIEAGVRFLFTKAPYLSRFSASTLIAQCASTWHTPILLLRFDRPIPSIHSLLFVYLTVQSSLTWFYLLAFAFLTES
jgi:hypothetical protein